MTIHSEAQLSRKLTAFFKLLNIYLNHFPKAERYALAGRIRNTAYEIWDLVTEGRRYTIISEMVDELGRMIGGWIGKVKEEGRW